MLPGLGERCIGYLLKLAHGESLRTAKSCITWQRNLPPPRAPR